MAKLEKLLDQVKEHLDDGEDVLAVMKGTYETKKMGNDWTRAGILAATDHRVVFYAKKMGGYDLEVFPYRHISSIETSKGMTGHVVKFFGFGERDQVEVHRQGIRCAGIRLARQRSDECPTSGASRTGLRRHARYRRSDSKARSAAR